MSFIIQPHHDKIAGDYFTITHDADEEQILRLRPPALVNLAMAINDMYVHHVQLKVADCEQNYRWPIPVGKRPSMRSQLLNPSNTETKEDPQREHAGTSSTTTPKARLATEIDLALEDYLPVTISRTDITCDWYHCNRPIDHIHVRLDESKYVHYRVVR